MDILKEYNNINSIYDDPIIERYQKEFEVQFDIPDDDADIASYDLDKQLFIDNYLDNIIKKLEAAKTENNEKEISEIIYDADSLRKQQTQLTKRQIIKKLSTIWQQFRLKI